MITDKVADLITRIRNAQRVEHKVVQVYKSNFNNKILDVLQSEGFIEAYQNQEDGHMTDVKLRYTDGQPCIKRIERVSKPGRRVYSQVRDFKPYFNGLGVNVLSTSRGVMSDYEAIKHNIGGEILFRVF